MPANRRFSQTPPDKANELFDKLLATSDNAVKTRERLLADLKEELELLANLQEQHLFPVLMRNGMHDLVQMAVNDNQETIALLTQLERMPKNSNEFLDHVTRLRRVFQQHIRDDKKELLPAVLEVLSEEEVEAVIEKVEDKMASIDEAKRFETQHNREQIETAQRVAIDVADTMRAGAESAQTLARTLQEAVESSFNTFTELARQSGQALQMFNRPGEESQGLTTQASQNFRIAAQSGSALARGMQDVSRECFELSQRRLQRNLEGLTALAQCRSISDFIAAQSSLIRDNVEQTVDNSRRIAELALQVTDEATRTVTVQVERSEKTAQRINRAA